jgi:hypothetical protein
MIAAVAAMQAETALVPPLTVLEMRAESRAYLWWKYQIEIHEAVDPLQEFAERSGLVTSHGQDFVQRIISAPFTRLRAVAAAEEARRQWIWKARQVAALERGDFHA